MIRGISGVFIGYAIFVISGVALFQLSGVKPHAPASIGFKVITGIYGTAFSILAGYVLQLIAQSKTLIFNVVLALIIAGFAAFSIVQSTGSSWTQLQAICIFAPVSVLGGWLRLKRQGK